VFLLVPAHPGSPGQRAVKRSLYVFISVAGSGATAMAHLDGTDVTNGVQRMMEKLKRMCRGAPEGRLSISFSVQICCPFCTLVTFSSILYFL